MKTKLLLAAAALAVSLLPANAVVVNSGDIGFTGVTNIQGRIEGNVQPGLSGTLGLTYTGLTNGGLTWNFLYNVTNTSGSPVTSARISSFGFQTNPNIVSASSTGLYNDPSIPANGYPGFLPGTVEFCFGSSPGTCTGGDGVTIGQSAPGTFGLTFGTQLASIDLQTAYFRFQSILPGTLCGQSATQECSGAGFNSSVVVINPNLVETPIPGAIWLFGTVLGAVFGGKKLRDLKRKFARREVALA